MKMNLLTYTIFFILTLCLLSGAVYAATANPTSSTVLVNGSNIDFDA